MKTRAHLLLASLLSTSCAGVIGEATGAEDSATDEQHVGAPEDRVTPSSSPDPSDPFNPTPATPLPSAALCNSQSLGRSYTSFDGWARETDRLDFAAGADRALVVLNNDKSDHRELERRFPQTLEVQAWTELTAALRAPSTESTFGVAPSHWFARVNLGPMTVVKLAALGFMACEGAIRAPQARSYWAEPHMQVAPTAASAADMCGHLMERAWRRLPGEDEIAACVQLATVDTLPEPDPVRRWAYACASIYASIDFITR